MAYVQYMDDKLATTTTRDVTTDGCDLGTSGRTRQRWIGRGRGRYEYVCMSRHRTHAYMIITLHTATENEGTDHITYAHGRILYMHRRASVTTSHLIGMPESQLGSLGRRDFA